MILVTGANGFVGNAVVLALGEGEARGAVRSSLSSCGNCVVGDIDSRTNWLAALDGITTVVHTAARVHIMDDRSDNPLSEYRRVNVDGTLNLARQAESKGVHRFIFLSSIKVNGEFSEGGVFTADDVPRPMDSYAVSKMEAEIGLREIARKGGMEVVIIRPPLVYGPGVKANFLTMMRWLQKGVPLPFGAIHNRRSLVGLDNLVDLIVACTNHPAAANQTFLVSDDDDLSTTQLLSKVGCCLGKKPMLLPVPQKLLQLVLFLLGRKDFAQRLCGSLQVDITKTKELLGWQPPVTVDVSLQKTVGAYLSGKNYEGG